MHETLKETKVCICDQGVGITEQVHDSFMHVSLYITTQTFLPLKDFKLGQFYKFIYKSWWPCAKSIKFGLQVAE